MNWARPKHNTALNKASEAFECRNNATFVPQRRLDGDRLTAVRRLFTLCLCRMIIFDIHVVRILRLCRNDVATRRENMADLRLRSHNNNTARARFSVRLLLGVGQWNEPTRLIWPSFSVN